MADTNAKFLTREEWDRFAPLFRDLTYRQCGSYAEAAARDIGATSEFVAFVDDEDLVGLANVRVKRLPFLPLGIAYLNYGPLTARRDRFVTGSFGRCLDVLAQEYVKRRGLVLRVVPPIHDGQCLHDQTTCFETRGFSRSRRYEPQATFILDVAKPLEEIRNNFDSKWRSDLNRAQKINIRVTKTTAPADFDIFEPIFLELVQQKNFATVQDVAFFRRVQEGAQAYERLVAHLAWYEGELVAGHIGSFVGDTAVYLLGAATPKGREIRASFLLQWAVIEYAKSVGNLFYDLGGVNQQKNPSVYRFKQRLNGCYVMESAPYEIAPSKLTGRVVSLLEDAYKWLAERV